MKRAFMAAAGVVAAAAIAAVPLTSGAASNGESKALFATLTGEKEVGPDGKKRAGDLDGLGSFTAIIEDGTQICYGITVKDIATPTAAHIHIGSPSVAGPIVLPLQHPTSGDPGASSECKPVDAELAQAILKEPHKYYVNVHNADFPGGAVRNQLSAQR
jgi:hypothetical protein